MTESDQRYRILFTGKLLGDNRHDDVAERLVNVLKIPADKAMRLIIGRKHYLSKEFERDKAERLSGQIKTAGAECRIVPVSEVRKKKLPDFEPPPDFL